MRYRCLNCRHQWDADPTECAEFVACPNCAKQLRVPRSQPAPEPPVLAPTPLPTALPAPGPPVMIPIPVPTEHPDYVEEKIEDMRDRRRMRREREREDREDRSGNVLGATGLALNATAFLFVISGALFSSALRVYSWFAAVLSVPLVLAGLPCCIIAGLRAGRVRYLSWVGTGLGALLLLVLIPALMLVLLPK